GSVYKNNKNKNRFSSPPAIIVIDVRKFIPHQLQILTSRSSVSVLVGTFDRRKFVFAQNTPEFGQPRATAARKQSQLPLARFAPQEFQHLLWVGAGQPLGLGHGPSPRITLFRFRRKPRQPQEYTVNVLPCRRRPTP